MSNTYYTTGDYLNFQKADGLGEGIVIADVLNSAPAIRDLPAIPWDGTQYDWLRQTGDAGAGFRAANEGVHTTKAAFTLVEQSLHYLDASFDLDLQLYKRQPRVYSRLAMASLQAALFHAEEAILMGTTTFNIGMANLVPDLDDSMVVDAGGEATGESHGDDQTTVYLVYASPIDGYALVLGDEGRIAVSEPFPVSLAGANDTAYTAMRTTVDGWMTAQYGNLSVGRIVNVPTADMNSTTALTDDHIATAIAKFPAAKRPNRVIMNTKAQALLRNSRTATNPTGAPAPFPTEVYGAQIIVTDGIPSDLDVVA